MAAPRLPPSCPQLLAMISMLSILTVGVRAGQAPFNARDVGITANDRIFLADQSSNSVSVIDPSSDQLLGVIRLGLTAADGLKAVYRKQLLVHGMGYSPDFKTIGVICVASNSVAFIDTATNTVKNVTYVGRAPHEAMWTPDGKEIWVSVRGEDFIQV